MQQLTNQTQQTQESYSFNAKTNRLLQLYRERAKIIGRWLNLVLVFTVLGILILITILSGGLFLSEILSSSFIIMCLFILKRE